MSALEVVGKVLGSLPLVVIAAKTYIDILGKWGHREAAYELNKFFSQLSTERMTLQFVCERLLRVIVRERDIDRELQNPTGPLWQAKKSNDKIRRALGNSYAAFESTVFEVKKAIDSMGEELEIVISMARGGQISSLIQVTWAGGEYTTGEFKAFLHSLRRENLRDAFTYFSNRVNNLQGLLTRPLTGHETLIRGKVRNVLRDVSASIARISGL